MTNDRRKIFPDPLSFWQWAIMEPGKRKAKFSCDSTEVIWIVVHPNGNPGISNNWSALGSAAFPLTAVEDEHGVIPEQRPQFRVDLVKIDPQFRDYFDALSKEAALYRAAELEGILEDKIRKLIREEIAAATVEFCCVDRWQKSEEYRLKPKEE